MINNLIKNTFFGAFFLGLGISSNVMALNEEQALISARQLHAIAGVNDYTTYIQHQDDNSQWVETTKKSNVVSAQFVEGQLQLFTEMNSPELGLVRGISHIHFPGLDGQQTYPAKVFSYYIAETNSFLMLTCLVFEAVENPEHNHRDFESLNEFLGQMQAE